MPVLQTKRPNIKNHIGIYYPSSIDSTTIQDICIKEILELCGTFDFSMNFTYAIYADNSLIADNIFIPIFHTFYLNSDPKIIVLRDKMPIDILELYPYHDFCIYNDEKITTKEDFDLLKNKFPKHKLRLISSLKDLI
jgi:hypothetical protein